MHNRRSEMHRTLGLAMGTLNTCLVMVLIVVALHLSNELADFLGGLSTAVGLGVFVLLWSTVTYCTYRGWAEIAPEGLRNTRDSHLIAVSAHWGAVNGMAFFSVALTAILVGSSFLVVSGGEQGSLLGIWVFGVFAAVFGLLIAATVGFILGTVLATFDFILAKVALAVLRPSLAPLSSRPVDRGRLR